MIRDLKMFLLGSLAVVAGTVVAQQATQFLNVQVLENLDVDGDTSVVDLTITGTCTGCPEATPGGMDTEVQFNNMGAFGGDANFLWNGTTLGIGEIDTMTVNGSVITSHYQAHSDTAAIYESHTHADVGLGGIFYGARSRGSEGSPTIVANGDQLFGLYALGYDGTDYAIASLITTQVAGTPGDNDMPSSIIFGTTPDGASTPTTRMTIGADGTVDVAGNLTVNGTCTGCGGGGGAFELLDTVVQEANDTFTLSWVTLGDETEFVTWDVQVFWADAFGGSLSDVELSPSYLIPGFAGNTPSDLPAVSNVLALTIRGHASYATGIDGSRDALLITQVVTYITAMGGIDSNTTSTVFESTFLESGRTIEATMDLQATNTANIWVRGDLYRVSVP
jgi:hypothetical protein